MGLMSLFGQKSKFEPDLSVVKVYLDLFERLSSILEKAEADRRDIWTEADCEQILGALKREMCRKPLPDRNQSFWQVMLVQYCLQPCWDQLCMSGVSDEGDVSRHTQLICRVIDLGHSVGFWKHILECESVILPLVQWQRELTSDEVEDETETLQSV